MVADSLETVGRVAVVICERSALVLTKKVLLLVPLTNTEVVHSVAPATEARIVVLGSSPPCTR